MTMLGTVPSLVKYWKSSKCMEGLDWSKIRCLFNVSAFLLSSQVMNNWYIFYEFILAGYLLLLVKHLISMMTYGSLRATSTTQLLNVAVELNLHLLIYRAACCSHKLLVHLALHQFQQD